MSCNIYLPHAMGFLHYTKATNPYASISTAISYDHWVEGADLYEAYTRAHTHTHTHTQPTQTQ